MMEEIGTTENVEEPSTSASKTISSTENAEHSTSASKITSERDLKINNLVAVCENNSIFFSNDNTENGHRLYLSFLAIIDTINIIRTRIAPIESQVQEFDFDENTPGNGYRSFLIVIDSAIQMTFNSCQKVLQKRDGTFFRKTTVTKDIESCSHLLSSLENCLTHLGTILCWSTKGNLFVNEDFPLKELFSKYTQINQHCFYGRNLGFQYCDSIKNVLQFIALSMTLFSEVYYNQESSLISKATNSVVSTTKFITDPERRAKRIVNIARNAEIDFCKAFWFLSETELMNQLPSIVSPSVAISKIILIPPEPITIETTDGQPYEVPVPSSFIGRKSVQVRLISHKMREGMLGTGGRGSIEPPSKGLVIHCHGGGFVAQSSKSHDAYLREWAKQLNTPILCIDYSLAPEAPFPRALEEVLYAYCWARKNHDLLGSTGEIIIGAGDSAGANLLLSSTLKSIQLKIPTMAGLFIAYVPTIINYIPSPARLLCLMDPLIPFGFLMRCLKAYACPAPHLKTYDSKENLDTDSPEQLTESDPMELQARRSPTSGNSDTEDSLQYMDDAIGSLASNEFKLLPAENGIDKSCSSASSTNTSQTIHSKLSSFVYNLKDSFTKYLGESTPTDAQKYLDVDLEPQSNLMEKLSFEVPRDPFLSPLYASDDDLKEFPPTCILSVEMDPCLDDCIMFAKRLKNVGNNVTLDILTGLPHGFLNFSLFSREAYEGSKVCIGRIQELLKKKDT